MFDWKWYLKDIKQDRNVTVFSCFSCGGGSTMGYKRAGFRVIGNCEIDKSMNEIYKINHNPEYSFLMDLRDFNKLENLPDELYHLDILDGSPPCSTFSFAGKRERSWSKEKVFREGQKKQTLDDLFFVFLDTVEKLKPKIVIAENVTGIVKGNAKGYVNQIIKRFGFLGYKVQIFQLNSAFMNVPQARERIFFIANNQNFKKLKLDFNEKPILFKEVRSEKGKAFSKPDGVYEKLLTYYQPSDKSIADISRRVRGMHTGFSNSIVADDVVCRTLTASGMFFRACDRLNFSDEDFRNVSAFPQDYDFRNRSVQYICGMSVPPNMTAHIAEEVYRQ
ncbi:MAG: DNA (cytosine-5-)-methyltransferase [Ruminococcus flavefaciens]|nr:DNA (cytosine-5-)-methyltransferase [Ruminococcus flavefaciens]